MPGVTTAYQSGNHAGRPAASSGCILYACSDHNLIYRSDGSAWATWANFTPTAVTFSAVRLGQTGAQSISTASATKATFGVGTEVWDTDAFHDTGSNTSRMTVPTGKDGKYRVTATALFAINATGVRRVRLLKNNAGLSPEVLATIPAHATLDAGISLTVEVALVATDYIELEVYQNSGGNLNVTSTLGMHLIGA